MPDFWWGLINVEEFWDKREYFASERWEISFFCKDCWKNVEVDRKNPKWYVFKCRECEWKNIAIWTEESLKTKYQKKK